MRKHLIKNQDIDVMQSHRKYENRNGSEFDEPVEANPDSLSESDGIFHISDTSKETQARVQKLLKLAKQILTERQYQVFDLMALKEKTIRQTARLLKLSPGRIGQLWDATRLKLQKAYDERTEG